MFPAGLFVPRSPSVLFQPTFAQPLSVSTASSHMRDTQQRGGPTGLCIHPLLHPPLSSALFRAPIWTLFTPWTTRGGGAQWMLISEISHFGDHSCKIAPPQAGQRRSTLARWRDGRGKGRAGAEDMRDGTAGVVGSGFQAWGVSNVSCSQGRASAGAANRCALTGWLVFLVCAQSARTNDG